MAKFISKLGGRKFVIAVLGVAVVLLNEKLSLNIEQGMVEKAADLIMIFIASEGAADVVSRWRA